MATKTTDDQNDEDALVTQLGGDKAGVSTTQPVKDDAPAAAAAPPAWDPSKVEASVFQGFTPKHAMEGFDWNREQNTGKSAKDAFAYLSNQAPPPPIQDKAALGQWFNQYIRPGMNALGHTADEAQGDKFHFKNWQGDFNVDFGRGAGAEGGALAWQVDDPSAQLSNAAYVPRQQQAAQNPALINAISGGAEGGADPQAQLKQMIDEAIAGKDSSLDQQALLDQLQV